MKKSLLALSFAAALAACGGDPSGVPSARDQAIADASQAQSSQYELRMKIAAAPNKAARAALIAEYNAAASELYALVERFAIDPFWCLIPVPSFDRYASPKDCQHDFSIAQAPFSHDDD